MKSKRFPYKNSKEFKRKLMNVAYISIGLPMVLFLWLFLEMNHGDLAPKVMPPYEYLVIIFCGVSVGALIWMASKIFKSGIKLARNEPELKEKLIIYEKISNQKFIHLMIASFITAAGLFLCANEVFGIIYAVLIIIFSLGNPTREKIVQDLRLNRSHKEVILKGMDFHFHY